MNQKYLTEIEAALAETRPRLKFSHDLEFKNSFGAVAGYLNNQIFIVYGSFGLALGRRQFKLPTGDTYNYPLA
jgi:hypothetical protein